MNSTAFFYIADLHLHLLPALCVLFFHWWTIWFVLGRNFSATSLMLLMSRGLAFGVLSLVLLSGVVGQPAVTNGEYSLVEQIVSAAMLFVFFVLSDVVILKIIMQKLRSGFKWSRHDLMSFAVANVVYIAGVVLFS